MIRVLLVDDSAVVRRVLRRQLARYEDIEVVGTAADPYDARDAIVRLKPDVVTLDVEMPRMDGLSFLEKLMQHHPLPVVVVSSLTPRHSQLALQALSLGAVEVVCKPGAASLRGDIGEELGRAIHTAARAVVRPGRPAATAPPPRSVALPARLSEKARSVIAVGASTGGVTAIQSLLMALPSTTPGIVIAQHMPEHFTASLAQRLDQICALEVREAKEGDRLGPGLALIAPGDHHMVLVKGGPGYAVHLRSGPKVHYQRPSVDVLFESVAGVAGPAAVGVLLTGMGSDGAAGLLSMKERGARTVVEAESSCVVFGMPKEAIELGAADEVASLLDMPSAIYRALEHIQPAGSTRRSPGKGQKACTRHARN